MIDSTPLLNGTLTVLKPQGKPITITPGEIIEAKILDALETGGITLKIKGGRLTAKSDIPIQKYATAFFRVLPEDAGGELRLQFIGYSDRQLNGPLRRNGGDSLMVKVFHELSGALLTKGAGTKSVTEVIENLFKALPAAVHSDPKEAGIQMQRALRDGLESSGLFQAFLPFPWKDLEGGDLTFRRGKRDNTASYSCRLNLDLSKHGKLSVVLLMIDREFLVYFMAEKDALREILSSHAAELKGAFAGSGANLRVTVLDKDASPEEIGKIESCERIVDVKA